MISKLTLLVMVSVLLALACIEVVRQENLIERVYIVEGK